MGNLEFSVTEETLFLPGLVQKTKQGRYEVSRKKNKLINFKINSWKKDSICLWKGEKSQVKFLVFCNYFRIYVDWSLVVKPVSTEGSL